MPISDMVSTPFRLSAIYFFNSWIVQIIVKYLHYIADVMIFTLTKLRSSSEPYYSDPAEDGYRFGSFFSEKMELTYNYECDKYEYR